MLKCAELDSTSLKKSHTFLKTKSFLLLVEEHCEENCALISDSFNTPTRSINH